MYIFVNMETPKYISILFNVYFLFLIDRDYMPDSKHKI